MKSLTTITDEHKRYEKALEFFATHSVSPGWYVSQLAERALKGEDITEEDLSPNVP